MHSSQYLEDCLKCGKKTTHKTSICMDCRKKPCLGCKKMFAALDMGSKFCANCRSCLNNEKRIEIIYHDERDKKASASLRKANGPIKPKHESTH